MWQKNQELKVLKVKRFLRYQLLMETACQAGADYIGFVLLAESRRRVGLNEAPEASFLGVTPAVRGRGFCVSPSLS